MQKFTIAFGLAALVAAGSSHATIIWDNGAGTTSGAASDVVLRESVDVWFQRASNLTLNPGANTITSIHWWGFYGDVPDPVATPPADDFTLFFFDDNSGVPGNVLHEVAVTPVRTAGDVFNSYFEYSGNVAVPITLAPGTTHWMSILNDTTGDEGGPWYWSMSSSSASADDVTIIYNSSNDSILQDWADSNSEFAYYLIPEPSAAVYLVLGMAGFAAFRRRR